MNNYKVSRVCAVCDEYSDQVEKHYDCLLCNGCRAFFKREVHNNRQLSNCRHGNQCLITVETRTRCKSCRWRACLRAKANIHKVQRENSNNTRRKRSSPDPDGSNADDRESIREHNLGHPLMSVYQAPTYSQSSSTVFVNGQSHPYHMSLLNSQYLKEQNEYVNAMHHPSVSGSYKLHTITQPHFPPIFNRYHHQMAQTPLPLRSLDLNQPQHLAQMNLQVNGHYQPPNSASGFSFESRLPGYIPNVPFNINSSLANSFVFNPESYQVNSTPFIFNDPNISLTEANVNDTTNQPLVSSDLDKILHDTQQSSATTGMLVVPCNLDNVKKNNINERNSSKKDVNDIDDGENIDVETSFSEHVDNGCEDDEDIDVELLCEKDNDKTFEYDNKSSENIELDSAEDNSIIDYSSSSTTHLYITKSIKLDTIISPSKYEQSTKNANNFMIDQLLGDIIHNSSSTVEEVISTDSSEKQPISLKVTCEEINNETN